MTNAFVSRAAPVAALAVLAAPAAAQDNSPDLPRSTAAADIVVTASRAPRPLAEVGEAVTVIATDEIETRQSNTVVELLRSVPGVTFVRNGGIGTVTGVNIRGAESDQTVALIDGIRINDPAAPGGGFNFGNLLTGNIARIEVVRGSQSVIWGSQAIGGVVNMITRAPTEAFEVNARAEGGWRDTYQAVANVSGRSGPVAASFGGGYFTTDGLSAFNAARGGTERDGYENVGANGKLLIDLSETIGIDLRGFYSRGRADQDGFPAPLFAFADTLEESRTEEFVGYAGVNATFLDGRFRNRIAFTYTDTDRRNIDRSFGAPAVTFDGRGRNERFEYQGIFTPSARFEAVFGAESETQRFATASFGGPVSRARIGLDSIYAQASGAPIGGMRLTAGIRHDDHQAFGGNTSVAANGVYSPNGGATTIRASYGEGFKAPTLFQLRSEFGNLALQPEQSKSYDAGIVQRLVDGRIEIGATWFRRDTRNQIDFISCFQNASTICIDRPFGTYDNIRRTRAQGVEATVAMTPVDALTFRAQYSLIDTENRDTGLRLARRPEQTVSALVDYRWPFGLETGATIAHVGDSFDNPANTVPLDGYVLVDLRASFPVSKALAVYGRVENLLDEAYETVFRYGTAGRAAYVGVRLRI
jgi:vitamin B12 transporter